MVVERISGNRPVQPLYELGPVESIKPLKKQPDPTLYRDSIQSWAQTVGAYEEFSLNKQWVEAMQLQRENLTEGTQLRMGSIKEKMEESKTLRKTHFDLMEEIHSNEKTSNTLGWVDTGLTVALVAGGIAGIAFALFTGGASLFLTAATAAAGLADGGVKIANGVIKHQTNLKSGELLKIGEQRKMADEKVKDELSQLKQSHEKVMETWQLLGRNERAKQDTTLDVINNMRVL